MRLFLLTHFLKIVSDYLGGHEDEHDGKAVGDVSRRLHHDDGQTERHSHNAACGEQLKVNKKI